MFCPAVAAAVDCRHRANALVRACHEPAKLRAYAESQNAYALARNYALFLQKTYRAARYLRPYEPRRIARGGFDAVEMIFAIGEASKTQIGRISGFGILEYAAVVERASDESFLDEHTHCGGRVRILERRQHQNSRTCVLPACVVIDIATYANATLFRGFRRENLLRADEIIRCLTRDY